MNQSKLLLGATGRLGQMLVSLWGTQTGWTYQSRTPRAGYMTWDPTDPVGWSTSPTAVVSLLGVVPRPGADLDLNARLAEATLREAEKSGTPRILLASSSAVYGVADDGDAFDEDSLLAPVNAYGKAKARMENVALTFRRRGLDVCCLRIGNVCGADALIENARLANTSSPLRITQFPDGDGPVRSYIGPESFAQVIEGVLAHPEPLPAALNVGASTPLAMSDLATAEGAPWVWTPAGPGNHQHITIDCSRMTALTGLRSIPSDAQAMVQQLHRLEAA